MRSLHIPRAEFSPLPVDEVRGLHNLAMGLSRQIAEARGSRLRSDRLLRKHRYAFFVDSGGRVGDDSTDQYLGVRVVKQAPREWWMSISFLDNKLQAAYADSNSRELNSFLWNDEQAYGLRRTREAIGKLLLSQRQEAGGQSLLVGGSTDGVRRETLQGLTVPECENIAERMLNAVSAPRAKAA